MVGESAGDGLGALRLTVDGMPLAHEFPGRLDGFTATVGKEDALHTEGSRMGREPGAKASG